MEESKLNFTRVRDELARVRLILSDIDNMIGRLEAQQPLAVGEFSIPMKWVLAQRPCNDARDELARLFGDEIPLTEASVQRILDLAPRVAVAAWWIFAKVNETAPEVEHESGMDGASCRGCQNLWRLALPMLQKKAREGFWEKKR